MQRRICIAAFLCATLLTGCQEPGGRPGTGVLNGGAINKQDVGTLAGAIGGGVVGSTIGGGAGKVAATIGGALLGGMLGNNVGRSLDNADMAEYDRETQYAMDSGHRREWRNNSSGNYGAIYPQNEYRDQYGRYCREYTQTIVVGGQARRGHGTACKEEDGTWRIVD